MGDSHITDHPIHNENDNKNPDPRTDLSTENLNFSFLLLRKRLEFHGRRADKEWKEFRREIRKEVASAGLREISRQTEPKRWHAETLRISRKMIAEQKRWDKVSGGIRKQEELAYWLVSRECSLVGEPSGFGKDEDEAGNQLNPDSICVIENRKKLPLRKRDRVPKSNHKDLIVSDIQGDDSGDEGARLPKPSSLKRPRRSASPEISHPSAKKLKLPRKKTRSSKEGKRSLRVIKTTNETINDTHEDSPQDTIKPASSPLMRRREIHEIKRLELQAEEIQLQLLEKIQAFKEKHGISHISAADF